MFALIQKYFNQEAGGAPTDVDPSGWLDVLVLGMKDSRGIEGAPKAYKEHIDAAPSKVLAVSFLGFRKTNNKLPFRVNLIKYSDDPGFYKISDDLPWEGGVTMNPIPFKAENDEDALQKLEEKLKEYNTRYQQTLFAPGSCIQRRYGNRPGLLQRMADAENAQEAGRVYVEDSRMRDGVG